MYKICTSKYFEVAVYLRSKKRSKNVYSRHTGIPGIEEERCYYLLLEVVHIELSLCAVCAVPVKNESVQSGYNDLILVARDMHRKTRKLLYT